MSWNDTEPLVFGDRYVARAHIGSGGAGDVYEVEDRVTGVVRALKLLYESRFSSGRSRERFFAEAKLMAKLHHPAVLPVYDVAMHRSRPFFVMEFAKRGTVKDWSSRAVAPLNPLDVGRMALQILDGLAYAHDWRIVHRDVKPENILIVEKGRFKLADFGVAKYDDPTRSDVTKSGDHLGTLGFMAPEQRIDARNATAMSDIYGMGAVLFSTLSLCAQPPVELYRMDITGESFPLVPRDYAKIIRKATSARPSDRYASARAMRDAIQWAAVTVET